MMNKKNSKSVLVVVFHFNEVASISTNKFVDNIQNALEPGVAFHRDDIKIGPSCTDRVTKSMLLYEREGNVQYFIFDNFKEEIVLNFIKKSPDLSKMVSFDSRCFIVGWNDKGYLKRVTGVETVERLVVGFLK